MTALDRAREAGEPVHDHLHATSNDIAKAGRRGGIVDRGPLQASRNPDPLRGQVRNTAPAQYGDIDLAGAVSSIIDQLRKGG